MIVAASAMVLGGNMVKVIAWYDNEWGYSCRVAHAIAFVAARLPSRRAHNDRQGHPAPEYPGHWTRERVQVPPTVTPGPAQQWGRPQVRIKRN